MLSARRLDGDLELASALAPLCRRRRSRDVAAVVVELDAESPVRMAFARRADPERRFELGSLTMALTGLLVADAIQRGELTLDTTVADLHGAYRRTAFGRLSVRDLATHTSGLALTGRLGLRGVGWRLFGMNPYGEGSPSTLMAGAARAALGRRGQHLASNLGAAVLGEMVAVAAGRDYPTLLEERIFTPLSMSASTVSAGTVTARWGSGRRHGRRWPWRTGAYAPALGVLSTPADMSRLIVALLDGSAPGCDALEPVPEISSVYGTRDAGLFWVIQHEGRFARTPYVWHGGQSGGYGAHMVLWPQLGRGIVVLASVANPAMVEEMALALSRLAPRSPARP